jgi:hypothetical protein
MLTKDFRNSYKYSQGNPIIQRVLFTLLRDHYTATGKLEGLRPALSVVAGYVGRFAIPPQHKDTSGIDIHKDFNGSFTEFNLCLTDLGHMPMYDPDTDNQLLPSDRNERLHMLLEKTAKQDNLYLGIGGQYAFEGRPGAEFGRDPYESYFRTYILGGADTHSDAYNAIFADARGLLLSTEPHTGFEWVEAMWKHRHPDEQYYPSLYTQELERLHSTPSRNTTTQSFPWSSINLIRSSAKLLLREMGKAHLLRKIKPK